ncbi:Cdc73p [Sporobolomyces koalae]|uniref:Cdc73p n=1 Tax=Sporobolomyces koalae TaxID=500713 RepID=UPI003171D9DE
MAPEELPDALLCLRATLASSRSIKLTNASTNVEVYSLPDSTHISFPHLPTAPSFPKQTRTRFVSIPNVSDLNDDSNPTYDLETLLCQWINKDMSTAEYLKHARSQKVGFVSVTDRKLVTEYLSGGVSTKSHPSDPNALVGTRIRPLTESETRVTRQVLPELGASIHAGADASDSTNGAGRSGALGGADGRDAGDGVQPPMKKARYTADKVDQDKVKRMLNSMEGPQFGHVVGPNETKLDKVGGAYHSRETTLRGERYNNFDSVRTLIAPRLQTLQATMSSSSSKPSTSSSSTPGALKPVQSNKKKQLNPIIMISPSSTALITMHNVKEFLEEARFIPSDQARSLAAGSGMAYIAEDVVQVNHNRATGAPAAAGTVETRKARYFVVDSVEALGKFGKADEAWDRVVCVMTTGQEWQFKPYKWKEPKELFHNVRGVYPQWTTDPLNPKVKAWNVSELRIDPHKRHVDKAVVADFWKNLEGWISVNKSWLSY